MQRDKAERLTDIVIGEAVTVMLAEDDAISAEALARQLSNMMSRESDPARLTALQRAVAEVQAVPAGALDRQGTSVHAFAIPVRPNIKKH